MKYLGVPTTTEDMTCSLSMTGVTILTKSRFKIRHAGCKDIVQRPDKGFILKSMEESIKKPKKSRILIRKNHETSNHQTTIPKKKVSQYTVNKKEVTHRIRGFVNQMSGEKMLYFWTVSFPVHTSDDTAHVLLNKWLTRLRQERMLKEYLWVSERQENKTIHFHIVINQKMNVQKANKYMRASIMHSINAGEIQYSREAATRYNGVDIAKDRKTRRVINFAKQNKQKSLTNYLTKYVTKNDEAFTHLAWHSSRGYSNIITAVRFTWSEYQNSNCENLLDNSNQLTCEYFTFRRWKGNPPRDLLEYLAATNNYIQSLTKNN